MRFASVAAKLARVFLTRLGIPKLWREDPEVLWPYARLLASPDHPVARALVRLRARARSRDRRRSRRSEPPLCYRPFPRRLALSAHDLLHGEGGAALHAFVGDILMWTGAFPVRRGEGDRESLRQAREIARAGHMVGVFVEGTRQRFGYPGEVLPGAMMIALQEGVPIVPCGVYSFGWSPTEPHAVRSRLGRSDRRHGPSPLRAEATSGGRRSSAPRSSGCGGWPGRRSRPVFLPSLPTALAAPKLAISPFGKARRRPVLRRA